ncbi:MAG: diphosphomevalonate decarboxylase [Flavobacteriaceae bacterium]|nr:diphosphomevalonate decarboxylase [Flavobacteriaceae bacterium]|tara:strand:- start:56137 stop:57216 length:1080 start_codon:yes stop_codon:yes gene_type:complete
MTHSLFLPNSYKHYPEKGSVSYQSPSNIALVKYWGKYGEQLPKNASVSFTLSHCHTQTTLEYKMKRGAGFHVKVFLDGVETPAFLPKIETFFERIKPYVPFLERYAFMVRTTNSFPHSSGIASSASGMSALALCLVALENQLLSREMTSDYYHQKASFLARLGSGSAARSVEGPLVVWGEHPKIPTASNNFGLRYPFKVHPNFENYQDTILLVDKGEKQVSSTVGHDLMHAHPFAEQRFQQANDNLSKLISVFESGDLEAFIEIVESEALSLHAMMMTSMPYFILMKPNTLEIIQKLWAYRKETGSKVCFTLDAGANVHVLYPESEKDPVLQFISKELAQFCQKGQYICDEVGFGSKKL